MALKPYFSTRPKMLVTDINAIIYQVLGEMVSNLLSQLKQAGKEDQLVAVLEEVPRVRKDSGMPPLVTPTSQIVGTQAVFNLIGRGALQNAHQRVQGNDAVRIWQNTHTN